MASNNSKRLYTASVDALIKQTTVNPAEIESLSIPQTEKHLITILAFQPENAPAHLPASLITDEEFVESIRSKLFELIEIINNADDDNYPNHLSMGSIDNVFTSAIRRCYLVGCNKDIYPFVIVSPELNYVMSKIFILVYKKYLDRTIILEPTLTLYAMIAFQFACFTSAVRFNVSNPFRDSMYWQQVYDTMIDVANKHSIPLHKIDRKWKLN